MQRSTCGHFRTTCSISNSMVKWDAFELKISLHRFAFNSQLFNTCKAFKSMQSMPKFEISLHPLPKYMLPTVIQFVGRARPAFCVSHLFTNICVILRIIWDWINTYSCEEFPLAPRVGTSKQELSRIYPIVEDCLYCGKSLHPHTDFHCNFFSQANGVCAGILKKRICRHCKLVNFGCWSHLINDDKHWTLGGHIENE